MERPRQPIQQAHRVLRAKRVVHAGFDFCSRLKGTFIPIVTRDIETTDLPENKFPVGQKGMELIRRQIGGLKQVTRMSDPRFRAGPTPHLPTKKPTTDLRATTPKPLPELVVGDVPVEVFDDADFDNVVGLVEQLSAFGIEVEQVQELALVGVAFGNIVDGLDT